MTNDQEKQIDKLKAAGYGSRYIAETILGSKSKKSTVNDYLRRKKMLEEITAVNEDSPRKIHRVDTDNDDNKRILFISDLHIPYHHPDTLEFLAHLKKKYKPTRIICVGDEVDSHALSYHDSDPDLMSAGAELKAALPVIKELEKLFPQMDIVDSNHGSLIWRKAKTHGIPRCYIKNYNDVLEVGSGWKWAQDLTITLPTGRLCYIHHGKSNNVVKTSQAMSMCAVQGHFHEVFKIEYWANPTGLYWGLQIGCLIDDNSYAFAYNNVNLKRPIIGTGLAIDGQPVLEPMVLGVDGRWVDRGK